MSPQLTDLRISPRPSVSQGAGPQSDNVTFSESPGQSNSLFSSEFPPTPPPSQDAAHATDASTSQVDLSIGNIVKVRF